MMYAAEAEPLLSYGSPKDLMATTTINALKAGPAVNHDAVPEGLLPKHRKMQGCLPNLRI